MMNGAAQPRGAGHPLSTPAPALAPAPAGGVRIPAPTAAVSLSSCWQHLSSMPDLWRFRYQALSLRADVDGPATAATSPAGPASSAPKNTGPDASVEAGAELSDMMHATAVMSALGGAPEPVTLLSQAMADEVDARLRMCAVCVSLLQLHTTLTLYSYYAWQMGKKYVQSTQLL